MVEKPHQKQAQIPVFSRTFDEIPVYSRPGILIIKFQYFPGFPGSVRTLLYFIIKTCLEMYDTLSFQFNSVQFSIKNSVESDKGNDMHKPGMPCIGSRCTPILTGGKEAERTQTKICETATHNCPLTPKVVCIILKPGHTQQCYWNRYI